MKHYEIRVFSKQGKTSLIFHKMHVNDQTAISAAKEIAGNQPFDLWRGMDCVFEGRFSSHQMVQ